MRASQLADPRLVVERYSMTDGWWIQKASCKVFMYDIEA